MVNPGSAAKERNNRPAFLYNVADDAVDRRSVLDGYEIGDKIGEGGMATVYRGTQLSLKRPVAIKMLNQQMAKHSQVYDAFEREAVIIARLNHPNIINVIDRGIYLDTNAVDAIHPDNKDSQGQPFFIMEYVDGIDLAQLMCEGQLPLQKKLDICVQICKALSYAHKNGVIHRDVKPGNIIVDQDFNIKVLDFGIALFFDDADSGQESGDGDSAAQVSGLQDGSERDVMGTLNYMAPELNASAAKATAVSDIYSLGVVMYELFAGQLPNQAQRLKAPKETPLPSTIAPLIMCCMSPQPDKRPRSMIDLHDKILVLLRGSHLDKKRVKRANESINNRKTFSLIDIIREQDDSAVYLFIEKNSGSQFVVKKNIGNYQGLDTGRRISQLSHRNIVRVHGTSKNERVFIVVMDYQRGGSLQERLASPYTVDRFLPIAKQILNALAFVHKHDIIHGNLRPSNILFDDSNMVKLSDFGLCHHLEPNLNKKALEQDGAFRIQEEPLCPQSDLYACGVIFHLMLLGVLPRYNSGQLRTGRAFKRLPEGLQKILYGLLAQQISNRYTDASAVLRAMETLIDAMPTQVWSPETSVVASQTNSKKKRALLLMVVLLILLVGNAGFFTFFEGFWPLTRLLK